MKKNKKKSEDAAVIDWYEILDNLDNINSLPGDGINKITPGWRVDNVTWIFPDNGRIDLIFKGIATVIRKTYGEDGKGTTYSNNYTTRTGVLHSYGVS